MGFLALHIFSNAVFLLLVRLGRGPRFYYPLVGLTNYATAAVFALVALWLAPPPTVAPAAALWGAVNGAQYQVTYLLMYVLYGLVGVAVTTSIMRLSVVVPVLASIAIWHEWPTLPQAGGLILAACALPLLSRGGQRSQRAGHPHHPSGPGAETGWERLRGMALVGGTVLVSGCGLLAAKAFAELELPEQRPIYVLTVYCAATVLLAMVWPWRGRFSETPPANLRRRLMGRSVILGIALGAVNIGQIWALLPALTQVPGVIAFPVSAAGGLALAALGARFLLDERLGRHAFAGIGLAILAAALGNLR
jgi:drug/metabolite transporter (DMT)-like permease